jgi:hypothetical protein
LSGPVLSAKVLPGRRGDDVSIQTHCMLECTCCLCLHVCVCTCVYIAVVSVVCPLCIGVAPYPRSSPLGRLVVYMRPTLNATLNSRPPRPGPSAAASQEVPWSNPPPGFSSPVASPSTSLLSGHRRHGRQPTSVAGGAPSCHNNKRLQIEVPGVLPRSPAVWPHLQPQP